MNFNHDIFWKNFVHNMVWLREHHNISEERMAEILEIDVELLKKVEKGNGCDELSVDVVYKIYDFFEIAPKRLFSEKI